MPPMRAFLRSTTLCAALLVAPALPLAAQGAAPAAGIREELIQQVADAERKFVALAEATPQDTYGWRPAPGVRSVSEVLMHIVLENYDIPPMAGAAKAAGVTLTAASEQSVTDKAQIVGLLKQSFAYVRQTMQQVPDAQMDARVSMFGQQFTKRGVLLLIATHAHEHLGQSIAYARQNGIVPPWSVASGGDH